MSRYFEGMRTEYRFFNDGAIGFTVAEGEPPAGRPADFPPCFHELVRTSSGFANVRPAFRELGHLNILELDKVLLAYWSAT